MIQELIKFKKISDSRGELVAIEGGKSIPFDIQRIYYITQLNPSLPRGYHSHTDLKQVMICLRGSCKVILDNGKTRNEVLLNDCSSGLFLGENIWREMHSFTSDCIILVLANRFYDPSDYIRNYDDFLKHMKSMSNG